MQSSEEIALTVKDLSKVFEKSKTEKITALEQVTFQLKKGEILGVIGKNGSGKSTLLKVISQITGPSDGRIEYEGILTSIIEIGTGFHSDLSAKENVYLGGSLLGVSRKKMAIIYDDIVAFSGLSEYMEMPVKQFSSGMYLRLAFSVAFHSPIDILLLDEVLAVGDLDFRRKCHEKIRLLSKKGVSIILVSHNLDPILEFCDRCILLNAGRIKAIGKPMDVVENYVLLVNQNENIGINEALESVPDRVKQADFIQQYSSPDDPILLKKMIVRAVDKTPEDSIFMKDKILFRLDCQKQIEQGSFEISFYINNLNGIRVLQDSVAFHPDYEKKDMPSGSYSVECIIPEHLLNRGIYSVGIIITRDQLFEKEIPNATSFIIAIDPEIRWQQEMSAIIRPQLNWKVKLMQ